jgi:hypothetical protein
MTIDVVHAIAQNERDRTPRFAQAFRRSAGPRR